jgi:hypothetical protein
MPLGAFPLNLRFADNTTTNELSDILTSLLPLFHSFALTIPFLNDSSSRFYPESKDETLESGLLQLVSGTHLLVDERGMTEGNLGDRGKPSS